VEKPATGISHVLYSVLTFWHKYSTVNADKKANLWLVALMVFVPQRIITKLI
jgi:hypothetical protein